MRLGGLRLLFRWIPQHGPVGHVGPTYEFFFIRVLRTQNACSRIKSPPHGRARYSSAQIGVFSQPELYLRCTDPPDMPVAAGGILNREKREGGPQKRNSSQRYCQVVCVPLSVTSPGQADVQSRGFSARDTSRSCFGDLCRGQHDRSVSTEFVLGPGENLGGRCRQSSASVLVRLRQARFTKSATLAVRHSAVAIELSRRSGPGSRRWAVFPWPAARLAQDWARAA